MGGERRERREVGREEREEGGGERKEEEDVMEQTFWIEGYSEQQLLQQGK